VIWFLTALFLRAPFTFPEDIDTVIFYFQLPPRFPRCGSLVGEQGGSAEVSLLLRLSSRFGSLYLFDWRPFRSPCFSPFIPLSLSALTTQSEILRAPSLSGYRHSVIRRLSFFSYPCRTRRISGSLVFLRLRRLSRFNVRRSPPFLRSSRFT